MFGTFFGYLIVQSMTSEAKLPLMLAGISLGLLGKCGFVKMISVFRAGQQLSDRVTETRRILSIWKIEHDIDEKAKEEMEYLINAFNEAVPLRPLGAYNVNNSAALSTYGISFTYIIVLLQFRTSE